MRAGTSETVGLYRVDVRHPDTDEPWDAGQRGDAHADVGAILQRRRTDAGVVADAGTQGGDAGLAGEGKGLFAVEGVDRVGASFRG